MAQCTSITIRSFFAPRHHLPPVAPANCRAPAGEHMISPARFFGSTSLAPPLVAVLRTHLLQTRFLGQYVYLAPPRRLKSRRSNHYFVPPSIYPSVSISPAYMNSTRSAALTFWIPHGNLCPGRVLNGRDLRLVNHARSSNWNAVSRRSPTTFSRTGTETPCTHYHHRYISCSEVI